MKDRPEALQKVAATGDAEQLPPGAPIGMAIGAEIAPAHPAPVRTVRMGTAMGRGIDLTGASSRHHHTRWRRRRGLWSGSAGLLTGVAVGRVGETGKGLGLAAALSRWWRWLRWRRACGSPITWPCAMEQQAQPQQGHECQLVEEQVGNHGKTPSHR